MTAKELEAEALRCEVRSWTCPRSEREDVMRQADDLWERAAELRRVKREGLVQSLRAFWWRDGRRGGRPFK